MVIAGFYLLLVIVIIIVSYTIVLISILLKKFLYVIYNLTFSWEFFGSWKFYIFYFKQDCCCSFLFLESIK